MILYRCSGCSAGWLVDEGAVVPAAMERGDPGEWRRVGCDGSRLTRTLLVLRGGAW